MKKIFLESHNIKNFYSGFGQFNFHLIKSLQEVIKEDPVLFFLHAEKKKSLPKNLNRNFIFKKYFGFRRYGIFRVRQKFDLWHCLNQNTKIEPYHSIPYLLTIHDINFVKEISSDHDHPRIQRFQYKLNVATAITYISQYVKEQTQAHFNVPEVPQYVIYNGNSISQEIVENTVAKESDKSYLYSIGDFLERKNFHLLVTMMQYLPEYNLIISGNFNKDYGIRVKEEIYRLNLQNQITLTGKVSEEDKFSYMKGCRAFVFPSSNEGFGLPPIEAMAFGKPLFLHHQASLPEIGGKDSFYWQHLNPETMAKELIAGLSEFDAKPDYYSQNLKKRASTFNWNKAATEYYNVYKSIINK
ncbi:MAG: glycosyltransferase family 4 protein [Flavobacteriales bacterium]|nr:glycosyltransferase family 4 protein [Flavobacteriales bacterium]